MTNEFTPERIWIDQYGQRLYDDHPRKLEGTGYVRDDAGAAPVVDEARYDEAMDDRQKLGHQLACAATAFEDAVTQLKAVVEDAQIRVGASANCYNEPKEAQSGADYVASRVLTALETMKSSTAAATTAPVEQSDEVLCACRTFRLEPTSRAYLDGTDFVHTVVGCPECPVSKI